MTLGSPLVVVPPGRCGRVSTVAGMADGAGSGSGLAFKARRESSLTCRSDLVSLFGRLIDVGTDVRRGLTMRQVMLRNSILRLSTRFDPLWNVRWLI